MGYKVYLKQYFKVFKKNYIYLYSPYLLFMFTIAILYTGSNGFWYDVDLYPLLMAFISFVIPGVITNMSWSKIGLKAYYVLDKKSVKPILVNVLVPMFMNIIIIVLSIIPFYLTMDDSAVFINESMLRFVPMFAFMSLPLLLVVTASKLNKVADSNKQTLYAFAIYLIVLTVFLISIQSVNNSTVYEQLLEGLASFSFTFIFIIVPIVSIIYSYKRAEV